MSRLDAVGTCPYNTDSCIITYPDGQVVDLSNHDGYNPYTDTYTNDRVYTYVPCGLITGVFMTSKEHAQLLKLKWCFEKSSY